MQYYFVFMMINVVYVGFIGVQEIINVKPVYCANNTDCLPFSYCKTLQISTVIQYCRWGSGEPFICCPKFILFSECGTLMSAKINVSHRNVSEAAVGGFAVRTARSFPWMVALGEAISSEEYEWFCGATLLAANRAITAAHCIERRNAHIGRVGELDFSSSEEDAFPYDLTVASTVIHPSYKYPSFYYDIAIVKFKESVKFSSYVRPICLPDTKSSESYEGTVATLTGWGLTSYGGKKSSILQQVSVTVFDNNNCSILYKRPDVRHYHFPSGIIDSQLCAGDTNGGKDACQGDSGGPLVVEKGVYFLIGIISSGFGCGSKTFPGVYTRVSSFVDWIKDQL